MAVYLEEFLESIDSLPTEVQNHLIEIKTRDDAFYKLRRELSDLQKEYLSSSNGKEDLMTKIKSVYEDARRVSEEKCVLSERLVELIQKHDRKLMELLMKSSGGGGGAGAGAEYSNYLQSSTAASGINHSSSMKLIETSSDSSASSYGNSSQPPHTNL